MKIVPYSLMRTNQLEDQGLKPGEMMILPDGREVIAVPIRGSCVEFIDGEKIKCVFEGSRPEADTHGRSACELMGCGDRMYLEINQVLTLRIKGHDFAQVFENEDGRTASNRRSHAAEAYVLAQIKEKP